MWHSSYFIGKTVANWLTVPVVGPWKISPLAPAITCHMVPYLKGFQKKHGTQSAVYLYQPIMTCGPISYSHTHHPALETELCMHYLLTSYWPLSTFQKPHHLPPLVSAFYSLQSHTPKQRKQTQTTKPHKHPHHLITQGAQSWMDK